MVINFARRRWRKLTVLPLVFSAVFIGGGVLANREAGHAPGPGGYSQDQKIIAVGHRGTVRYAPENTLAAYDIAIGLGARAVEADVRYTADGHFVVIHDSKVNRTTDGAGAVKDMTLAEIKQLDAGSGFSPAFAGERVPTLRAVLRHLKGRAAIDIDFKAGPENSGELLAQILDEEGYRDGPLVTVFARSWDYEKLKAVSPRYALRPNYQNAHVTRRVASQDGVEVMGIRRRGFSFSAARIIRGNGLELFSNVMGRDDGPKGYADSVRAGARFIQTDKIAELTDYLDQRGLLVECVPARDLSCWTPPPPTQALAENGQ